MTYAYSSFYLDPAQDILGHAFDRLVNTCDKDLGEFCDRSSRSKIAAMFEKGYPKYVAGWVLAYFQWKSRLPFKTILKRIPITKILALYPTGHEQDIRNVVDILTEWVDGAQCYPVVESTRDA